MRGQQVQPFQHTFLWENESSDNQISTSGGQISSKLTSLPCTSDVHSIQKIVSSSTLFPVLLIIALHLMMPRWQQVTCSLVSSFLGMVGPKCRDGIKGRFQGRGQGSPALLIFRPKWGPKGRKNLLGIPPTPLEPPLKAIAAEKL